MSKPSNTPKMLCTICARGGSKGVPGKNIRLLDGLPLIAHTINHAKDYGGFEMISVSSDCDDILETAQKYGADLCIKRPDALAEDTSAKMPAILHAAQESERASGTTFNICVDLDATSPLRSAEDIAGAITLLQDAQCSNVITGALAHRSPYFNLVEEKTDGSVTLSKSLPNAIVRRQDSPVCYDMNASIYVWRRDILFDNPSVFYEDTRLFEMPPERSHDIDSELDFFIVENILRYQKREA